VTYRIVKVVPYAAPVATLDKVIQQNVNTKRPKVAYLSIQRSSGVLIASSRYTNAPAKRRDVPDKSTTLLIRYFREGGLSPGIREVGGDRKSARGPEIRRDNVFEMERRRT